MVMLHDEWSSQLKFKLMCGALALWGVVNVSDSRGEHRLLSQAGFSLRPVSRKSPRLHALPLMPPNCVQGNSPMVDSMLAGSVSAATETKLYTRLHICHVIAQVCGCQQTATADVTGPLTVLMMKVLAGSGLSATGPSSVSPTWHGTSNHSILSKGSTLRLTVSCPCT